MTRLDALDAHVKALWTELLADPAVLGFLTGPAIRDRRSYAIYLTQAYHYTRHTPLNQAKVALRPGIPDSYRRFCLKHADEEVGHENMALHDLRALGVAADPASFPMLPETEQKIAYLYWCAEHANPVSRLGYSFWAEDSYGPGGSVLAAMKAGMRLSDAETSFFTAHQHIDEGHALDVRHALEVACRTDADWEAVARAAEQSIRLTFRMLAAELRAAQALLAGEPGPFAFLAEIPS